MKNEAKGITIYCCDVCDGRVFGWHLFLQPDSDEQAGRRHGFLSVRFVRVDGRYFQGRCTEGRQHAAGYYRQLLVLPLLVVEIEDSLL